MGNAPNSSCAACRRAEMEDSFFAAWSIRNSHLHCSRKIRLFLRDSWSLRNDWDHNGNTVRIPLLREEGNDQRTRPEKEEAMRHPSSQRLLIIFAGILLVSIFWTGASHPSPAAAAQQASKTAGRTPIVLNTKPLRVVADAAPVLSGI